MLTSSRAISGVNFEIRTNISEILSISIIDPDDGGGGDL
jgi:hypothetical protein